jgi:uncharacterized protein
MVVNFRKASAGATRVYIWSQEKEFRSRAWISRTRFQLVDQRAFRPGERRSSMYQTHGRIVRRLASVLSALALVVVLAAPAMAGGYDEALKGVKGVKAVFDYGQGAPKMSNALFWAVKNVCEDESVRALSNPPRCVIVFRGAAVRLISSDRKSFNESDKEELDKFADTIRQLKKDGVKMEVCLYAAKSLGIDAATIMPEIDHVGNGFISVVGYQAQGYALVIP